MRPDSQPLTFADFELRAQGLVLEPTLQVIADFLDAHGELVTLVHDDLVRGLKRPRRGRDGLSAVRVLRAFVLQRVNHWDLRDLRERIADGFTLRRFTTLGHRLSLTAIHEVLRAEGFARLPRRRDEARPQRPRPETAAVADVRQFSVAPRRFARHAASPR